MKIAQLEDKDWKRQMFDFLWMYHATPHSTTGSAPGEIMFKRKIRDKLQMRNEDIVENEENNDEVNNIANDVENVFENNIVNDEVNNISNDIENYNNNFENHQVNNDIEDDSRCNENSNDENRNIEDTNESASSEQYFSGASEEEVSNNQVMRRSKRVRQVPKHLKDYMLDDSSNSD